MHPTKATSPRFLAAAVPLLVYLLTGSLISVSARPASPKKAVRPTARLRIEVTAGDANAPVPEASVYLKFDSGSKSSKLKQIELNLKTSQEGVAESPDVPQGKILVQVIAPGWKTYGEWFDVNQAEQTLRVHLLPNATKWY